MPVAKSGAEALHLLRLLASRAAGKPSVDVIKAGPWMIFSRNMDVIMLGGGGFRWVGNMSQHKHADMQKHGEEQVLECSIQVIRRSMGSHH